MEDVIIHWLCKTCEYGMIFVINIGNSSLGKVVAYCTLAEREVGDVRECNAYDEKFEDDD